MSTKRRLPVLERVELDFFTLYRNNRHVTVDLPGGVFCLAGANGLGKSSFLAALNFGLTGIAADPKRSFKSVREYYADSLSYSANYFAGRVDELDRDNAEVTVRFRIGGKRFTVTRNLFEPESLRRLLITSTSGEILIDGDQLDDSAQRHRVYRENLTAECRLSDFEQFVFLQHFLLTFDERRHLIFWDATVADPALYLAFGLNAEDAFAANELRRRIDRAESNARNAQWQATQARNRLRGLGDVPATVDEARDLLDEHRQLTDKVDEANSRYEDARKRREDALLAMSEASARHESLRQEYDREFNRRLEGPYDPGVSPVVQESIQEGQCAVCGTRGADVISNIQHSLEKNRCPLCDTNVKNATRSRDFDRLKALDIDLNQAQEQIASRRQSLARHADELKCLSERNRVAEDALEQFEREHLGTLPKLDSHAEAVIRQRDSLEDERLDAIRRRDEHRRRRDGYRAQLAPLQANLATAYRDGELKFVPLFRGLANQFIGLDLDIFLERKNSGEFALGLELQGSRRRAATELSESQRFFLDIALRMSLAQYMSDPDGHAALLVDTPEGSLDIAYEARAGSMFAEFVRDGHQLIMTANINASQLLIRLAEQCGSDLMRLVRMTDWTPLSEVQADEEPLFDLAYANIEEALDSVDRS